MVYSKTPQSRNHDTHNKMFSYASNDGFAMPGMQAMMGMRPDTGFTQFFRCYPVAMMQNPRDELNYGGKIVLPPSALNKLTMLHITYPMLFELKVEDTGLRTFGGVLEFVAEEGRVYLPQWMMETLGANPGTMLVIKSADLPKGNFVKIEPQSTDFLDITDPKAVLENEMRNFSTLTINDIFEIKYNNKIYRIKVLEAKPETDSESICVVETDLNVDFAPPVGYVDPNEKSASESVASRISTPVGTMRNTIDYDKLVKQTQKLDPFASGGQKLSGKAIQDEPEEEKEVELGIDAPSLKLPFGQLFFGFKYIPLQHSEEEKQREQQEATSETHFQGQGQSLRQSRKRKSTKTHDSDRQKCPSPEVIEID